MTAQDYKLALQSELRLAGFGAKITKVGEDDNFRTTIQFESKVNPELFRWLNHRFNKGVSVTSETMVTLNHPDYDLISN